MTVKTEIATLENEKVIDDLSEPTEDATLAALKAKMAKKESMPIKIVQKKTRSIKVGVVGSGQAGSRLAAALYNAGYDAVVFNTATQDLEHIKMPDANKYLLQYGLGGAGRDITIGHAAAEAHREAINELIAEKLGDSQVLMLCLSLGGGSGAGSCETMLDILSATGKPIVVMTVLPMSAEDSQMKRNALETLAKLADAAKSNRIHNIFIVDNAKIETIYGDLSPSAFFEVSNKAIVEPVDAFNTLSAMPSNAKGLDPTDWAKILTDGGGLSVYGEMTIANYEETTAIAEAVIENLNSGLLASGFDLKQSKYVGIIVVGRSSVMAKLSNQSITYAMSMVGEVCGTPNGLFHGVYESEDVEDGLVKVYSIFSGLGLPDARVTQLKQETVENTEKAKNKDVERNLSLKLDTGKDLATSTAEKVRAQIAAKKSGFGGLVSNAVQDRRKK